MSFDTTSVNTGPRNGACILLEQKTEKDMLWLTCHNHIMDGHHARSSSSSCAWAFNWARYTNFQKIKKMLGRKLIKQILKHFRLNTLELFDLQHSDISREAQLFGHNDEQIK
jgi:hypothetical protein